MEIKKRNVGYIDFKSNYVEYDIEDEVCYLEKMVNKGNAPVNIWIHLLFDLWYIVLEPYFDDLNLDKELLEQKLKIYFAYSYKIFEDDQYYLFFVGYILGIATWYFVPISEVSNTEVLARNMMIRSYVIDPDNEIYNLRAFFWTTQDKELVKENTRVFKEKLKEKFINGEIYQTFQPEEFGLTERLLGNYFFGGFWSPEMAAIYDKHRNDRHKDIV